MQNDERYRSFGEFFLFYLREHSHPLNRALHAEGTALALSGVIVCLATRHTLLALCFVPVGYAFAWIGHLFLERNRPATFTYPLWSFLGDLCMLGLILSGRLRPWMERARGAEQVRRAA